MGIHIPTTYCQVGRGRFKGTCSDLDALSSTFFFAINTHDEQPHSHTLASYPQWGVFSACVVEKAKANIKVRLGLGTR